jgi:hypothetical protein
LRAIKGGFSLNFAVEQLTKAVRPEQSAGNACATPEGRRDCARPRWFLAGGSLTRVNVWLSDDDHRRFIRFKQRMRAVNLDSALSKALRLLDYLAEKRPDLIIEAESALATGVYARQLEGKRYEQSS